MSGIFLVGNTGFVGSNILKKYEFDMLANSKNVQDMYNKRPNVLIYAGITGTKWYANSHGEQDKIVIESAKKNIRYINPQKLVLISSVDVIDDLNGKDEDYVSSPMNLSVYGRHRFELEQWALNEVSDCHIVRLPAIYGDNLRKNFIYDLINYIPTKMKDSFFVLVNEEYQELYGENLKKYYNCECDKMWNISTELTALQKHLLRERFAIMKHNALEYTNFKSEFQFYNLCYLWNHIENVIKNKIRVINLVTEPISASEICWAVDNRKMTNDKADEVHYGVQTKYAFIEGNSKYLFDRKFVIEDIKHYIRTERNVFGGWI